MTTRIYQIVVAGFILIAFVDIAAVLLDNVGEYQMNATWNCGWTYSEAEHQKWCRNELDGFGSLYDGGQR